MSEEPEASPPPTGEERRQSVVALAVGVEGGLIVLAWVFGWLLDQPPLLHFAWAWEAAGWGLLAALPMVVLFVLLSRVPLRPLRTLRKFSDEVIYPILRPCTVVDLLGISVLAGLGEEMLFRGVFQGAFARYLPGLVALGLASLLFGVLHAVTLTYAALATLMGAYLGFLYDWSGNLLAPTVTHAAYDFVLLLWLMRGPGRPAAGPSGGEVVDPGA